MIEVSFGEWLKRQRSGRGLTQEQLAHQIGCATITLRKIEYEERRPSAQIVGRLAEIFNIPKNEQADFLRFARGDWTKSPDENIGKTPWRAATISHKPRNNLPIQLTTFIGREKEIEEIKEALNNYRLVTLTGSGGTGKTRLSLQVAEDLLKQFDYTWFVELAPTTDPKNIPLTILSAIGLGEQKGKTAQELISDYLHGKNTLIILDNCEHLIEASAKVSYLLLNHASKLKILASSREALGVKGEMAWHVSSLSLPDINHLPELDELVQFEAIRLFTERAALAKSNFTATKENAAFIAQICSRLDGIPLAIELAAARIKALTVEQIAARLDDRFRLLTGGSRTALPRQQTLRATIDWSYNLLTEPERALLRHLTVFSGGWTLEAAESVCSEEGSGFDSLDLLTQLVDKSLVNQQDSRYRLLETTRQYAREKLLDSGEGQALHDRHVNYFLDLAKQADKEIHGPRQVEWLDRLNTEHDNYRAVLDWCITNGNLESALFLIGSFSDLGRFWSVRSYFSEARNWFDKVRAFPDVTLYPIAYATALTGMSYIASLQGDFPTARSMAEESQRICESLGADGELGLACALLGIGLAEFWGSGDSQRARTCFEQAAAIYRGRGNRWEQALGIFRLGTVARDRKDYEQARSFFEESLIIFNNLGDAFGLGRVHELLGRLSLDQGNYVQARRMHEQGLYYDRQLRFHTAVTGSLVALGIICRIQGDNKQAEIYFEEASSICREYNLSDDISPFYLGCVNLHRENYTVAKIYFIEFTRTYYKLGFHNQIGEGLFGLAAVAAGLHQYERAARLVGAGQTVHDAIAWVMDPSDRIEIDPLLQIAREQLGEETFEALAAEGRAMTMDQAIAYALEE